MKTQHAILGSSIVLVVLMVTAHADQDTIGPNGIDSAGLRTFNGQPLNGGGGFDIGQVEGTRPGRPAPQGADDFLHSNPTIVPAAVYLHNINAAPPANQNIDSHAEYGSPQ